MRADRLLSTLLLLQAHGRLTGRELAKRLEVSLRTVHRDMEALSAAGVPVYALRGSQGGWQLEEGWRTRVPGLDEAELRALLMAQPRVLGDPRLARAAERALDKLMAALPTSLREQAASIRQRLHVDTTGWRGAPESLAMLPIVQDAVARDRKLAIRYRAPGQERVERTLDPLGLVAKGGSLVSSGPDSRRLPDLSRLADRGRAPARPPRRAPGRLRPRRLLEVVHRRAPEPAPLRGHVPARAAHGGVAPHLAQHVPGGRGARRRGMAHLARAVR